MNKFIYYLSYYNEKFGFLFPDELPDNYYAPGLFLIEVDNNNNFLHTYTFDAMDNGKRTTLELTCTNKEHNSSLYVVRTKHYGSFWFNLERIHFGLVYIGKNKLMADHNNLAVLISTDSNKLEKVCKEYNFYFIGKALTNEELTI